MKFPEKTWCYSIILTATLAGCSAMPSLDYSEQAENTLDHQQWAYKDQPGEETANLLELIASPKLHDLVSQGLAANPSLKQTAISLSIAKRTTRIASADSIPSADFALSSERTEVSDTTHTGQLTIAWTLDIWGKLKDAQNAAQASEQVTQATYQSARDLLASAILENWLALIQQERLLIIQKKRLAVLEQNEDTIIERYRRGLDQLADLETAQSATESARASLISLDEEHRALRRTLKKLVGGETVYRSFPTEFPHVITPLADIPPQNLGRRPDLQQAYAEILLAEHETKAAYKALLPSLSLQAGLTGTGGALHDALFASPVWGLLGQLTQPLFHGGKLKAEAEIAALTAEQKYWAYRETLLNAVTEVENALSLEKSLQKQQSHIRSAFESAQLSSQLYTQQYRQGLTSFLDLLTIQKETYDLEAELTQITYQRLSNRIALGLALGLGV
jgi:NodT family efflux transporter outer membrane factor (OMF) lipoprotein